MSSLPPSPPLTRRLPSSITCAIDHDSRSRHQRPHYNNHNHHDNTEAFTTTHQPTVHINQRIGTIIRSNYLTMHFSNPIDPPQACHSSSLSLIAFVRVTSTVNDDEPPQHHSTPNRIIFLEHAATDVGLRAASIPASRACHCQCQPFALLLSYEHYQSTCTFITTT